MMNRKIFLTCVTLAAASVQAGATDVFTDDTSHVQNLDEVVVVAQPKETAMLRLQPLSSSVLTSYEMRRLQEHDFSRLSDFVPSFQMPQYGSRLTSSMYIRGIGSRINNPAVGVYYDNIPLMSKSAFNNHFYMIDRVDVMRGPQSTLYGQNAEGGLVRIYSKNPMNYQGTDIRLGIGNGLYSNVEVAHYHRPSDRLAFTVAGFYSGLKGFIDNRNFDQKNDLTNEAGGKVRLILAPNQKLKLDWTADYQYVNQNGFGYGEFWPESVLLPPGATEALRDEVQDPATTFMNGYKRNMLNTGFTISYEMPEMLFTSTTSYQFLQDKMSMDQDYMTPDYLRLQQLQKQNAVTQEFVLRSTLHPQPSTINWQHASGVFGAYQWLRTDAPVTFGDAITGPIGSAITSAMAQAMYQAMYGQMLQQMLDRGMPQAAAEAAAKQAAEAAIERAGISMSAEMAVSEAFHTPTLNLGVFHESNILLGDHLKVTLGLRLNYDKVKINYDAKAYMNMTGGTAERQATYHLTSHVNDSRSKSFTQLLPKFGLMWQFNENRGNVYGLVSKGYRMGGYNIQMFSDILQTELDSHQSDAMRGDYDVEHTTANYDAIEETISYKPEESWNFEVGTHLNLLEGHVHLDAALYYMKIRNQQLSVMSPAYNYGRIMTNAGKSHSMGAELALRGSAFGNALDWSATYSFTSAKFDEYDAVLLNVSSDYHKPMFDVVESYKDKYVPFVPQHTFSATADYHFGQFTLGANVSGQGKIWWDEANTYSQKLYALLGAHADYEWPMFNDQCSMTVSLWGRNLTDTKYNTFAVQSSAAGGTRYFAQRANPLQVGVDVSLHF